MKRQGAIFTLVSLFLLAILIITTLPVMGCGSATSTQAATMTNQAATTTTVVKAKPTGTLTVALPSVGSGCFVPWKTFLADHATYGAVYDGVGIATNKGRYIPSAATGWEFSSDYLTFTIHLRKGIQFQDGWGELTSADVKYCIEKSGTANSTSSAKSYIAIVNSIDTPDPYTVVVHLKTPNVDNAEFYALNPVVMPILCKKYVESVGEDQAAKKPVGSGPYKLVSAEPGYKYTFEAVEDHWRVVPEFKNLVLLQVPEESTRVAMLKTGQVDAAVIGPTSVAGLPKENISIESWPYGCTGLIVFGGLCRPGNPLYKEGYHNKDPWANIKVRQAMNIAIDRDAINKTIDLGTGIPLRTTHLMPGEDDLPPIPYDTVKAKQLLKESGYPNGFTFTLVNPPTQPGVPMIAKETEAVAGYWANIGINTQINPLDFAAYNPKTKTIQTAGECFSYRLTYLGTNPFVNLAQLNNTDPGYGQKFQCEASDVLTQMAKAALAELDLNKRTEMYKAIGKVEAENWIAVPLFRVPIIMAKNNTKAGDWSPNISTYYYGYEYVRQAKPLNTYRLFEINIDK